MAQRIHTLRGRGNAHLKEPQVFDHLDVQREMHEFEQLKREREEVAKKMETQLVLIHQHDRGKR